MKNLVKTSKWLRWAAAGAFGLMMTLNVMVGLEFEKGKVLPSVTLIELGNEAQARMEKSYGGLCCLSYGSTCYHPIGLVFGDSVWMTGASVC